MRKITNNQWNKVEYRPLNSYRKIGFYDSAKNNFVEVARWRNSYGKDGTNDGILQIWSITFDFLGYDHQRGNNYSCGYNKPIANLEGCLYQLKTDIENGAIITDCGDFNYSHCGSIESLIEELKNYLQKQYKEKLFILSL
jgi:hypothetical protein